MNSLIKCSPCGAIIHEINHLVIGIACTQKKMHTHKLCASIKNSIELITIAHIIYHYYLLLLRIELREICINIFAPLRIEEKFTPNAKQSNDEENKTMAFE